MSDERGEMTPRELDELASAYLDGETTAEEAALVESDPRLQARVEELRAVRALMATPVEPPSDEVRDQMIAQALDHLTPVVSLERARRRLRPVSSKARIVLAAAAVVAVIAMVGVTLFNQADRDGGDTFASETVAVDSVSATEAPAPESVPDSAEEYGEPLAGVDAPDSQEADMADAPAGAAEPPMPEDEAPASEGPEELVDDSVDNDTLEAPSDAAPEPADEPGEIVPPSGEPPLVFDTQEDLVILVVQLAKDLADAQGTGPADDTAPIDPMSCPLFPDEGIELLTRFDAVVEGTEAKVSVYLGENELRFTQTTPPPECELFNSHTFLNWYE